MVLPDLETDVVIAGAGPSGSIAAAILVNKGYRVTILERETFPRFSIGGSLLPQCMEFIEEAGMTEAVESQGFQFKNGAAFQRGDFRTDFDFSDKFTKGRGTTFQVNRGDFDKVLADEAEKTGATILYRHTIESIEFNNDQPILSYRTENDDQGKISARFVLDASGFGRVLPRLLDLNTPSDFPPRKSIFTHIEDNIDDPRYDRNKILVSVLPDNPDVWMWLIPFPDGRCSLGVVAEAEFFNAFNGDDLAILKEAINHAPNLRSLLKNAVFDTPVRNINGYSANVKSLYGKGYALLGNAGEFLDPVFSSGVTIAMKSASLASKLVDKQLSGSVVDWQLEYSDKLMVGINAFRTFVTAWYDQRFQDIIYHHNHVPAIKAMICSILAGYAWDENNPYVADSERRINVLAEICEEPA